MALQKIFLRETLNLYDKLDEEYFSPAGLLPDAGVDLIEWINQAIIDGLIIGGGGGGPTNLDFDTVTGTIVNSNGQDAIIPLATESNRGLMDAEDKMELARLIALSGVVSGNDLGSFNGNIIEDNSSIKEALQFLETAVETKQSQLTFLNNGLPLAPAGYINTINLTGGVTTSLIGRTVTMNVNNGLTINDVVASDKFYSITPTSTNNIPNLTNVPIEPLEVEIQINGVVEKHGITVDNMGIFHIDNGILGYDIESTDTITVRYFSS